MTAKDDKARTCIIFKSAYTCNTYTSLYIIIRRGVVFQMFLSAVNYRVAISLSAFVNIKICLMK